MSTPPRDVTTATAPLWGPTRTAAVHPLPAGTEVDVVVVGAGLAGASAALHLALRRPDLRVALLEAQTVAAGASGRGTGLLGPRIGPPADRARHRGGDLATWARYRRSESAVRRVIGLGERYAPGAVVRCAGQLVVGSTRAEQEAVRRRGAAYAALGLPVRLVETDDHASPAPPGTPALHYPVAAGVDPAALTRGLVQAAVAAGVLLADHCPVTALDRAADRTRVITTAGSLTARAVVVTVDVARPGLGVTVGDQLHLQVCVSATAPLPPDLLADLGGPAAAQVLSPAPLGAYRRVTPDGRLVLGGGPATTVAGRTGAGLAAAAIAGWAWQRAWLDRIHPGLVGVVVAHRWCGRVGLTADGLPVLARVPGPGEVWYAGGWNGHGLAATVEAGAELAGLVLGGPDARPGPGFGSGHRWALAHPAAGPVLSPVLRAYLATQVPPVPAVAPPLTRSSPMIPVPTESRTAVHASAPTAAPTPAAGTSAIPARTGSAIRTLRRPLEAVETSLARPTGRLGVAVGHAMSLQHHTLTRWTHRQLDAPTGADVLDVGCGSGHALRLLGQRCRTGLLAGVDVSPTMVDLTRRTNAAAGRAGRLDVRQGDALALPFPDGRFDVVTAIETLYFWPDAVRGLTECRRVLRPGGRLAVALEMTRDAADDPTLLQRVFGRRFTERSAAEGLTILSGAELAGLVSDAGFTNVRFAVEPRRSLGWVCVVAQAPGPARTRPRGPARLIPHHPRGNHPC